MEPDMTFTLTAYVEFDPETNLYIGLIPGIPGAHTQGATLDELQQNLRECCHCVSKRILTPDEFIEQLRSR